ncbi:hypothetical protein [Lacipirellula parvula]|uniref:DUF8108 domain-containing protein n=1 Tax=Lacipirellula parvula TaxID=2650471 RepID=A0A5K7X9J3_9BACT|nr:hypothetical protein [Lacipirellula parvula]BBO31093.1 hypothetical protein PLANPX_0705 [Lacipirellula parvula]
MAAPRLRRVSSKKELENMLDDYMTQGYEIIEQGQTTAMVRRKTWGSAGGHVLWGLLTIWFTLGFGNLAYALVAHYNAEKVMLKIDADAKG